MRECPVFVWECIMATLIPYDSVCLMCSQLHEYFFCASEESPSAVPCSARCLCGHNIWLEALDQLTLFSRITPPLPTVLLCCVDNLCPC